MTFGPATCITPSFHVSGVKRSFTLNSKIVIFREYLFSPIIALVTINHVLADIKTCHPHSSSLPTLPQTIKFLKHVLMTDMNEANFSLLLTRNSTHRTFWKSPMKLAILLWHIVIHGKWPMAIGKQERDHGWIWNCYWRPVGHLRFPSITAQSLLLAISNTKRWLIPTRRRTIKALTWAGWWMEKRHIWTRKMNGVCRPSIYGRMIFNAKYFAEALGFSNSSSSRYHTQFI